MIRINALNDGSLPDSSNEASEPVASSKEALEEESYALHRKALEHLQQENDVEAEQALKLLLQTPFVKRSVFVDEKRDGPLPPGIMLRYLAHKNLALIALRKGDNSAAMNSFLQAVDIDPTDVSVWYRMGITALKISNYPLARLSFEEGLQWSPTHWPCLDQVITLSFALNDYTGCLSFIVQGLERHYAYVKGLAFRDQIFKDIPFMRSSSESLFKNCDPLIYTEAYDKEEAGKLINEALEIRVKNRELSTPKPLPTLSFKKPFTEFTWKCLGENLVALYDYIKNSDPTLSIACLVKVPVELDVPSSETGSATTGTVGAEREKDGPASPVSSFSSSDESSTPILGGIGNVEVEPGAMEMDDLSDARNLSIADCQGEDGIFRHRAKKKKSLMDEQSTKRRSTRVRNTGGIKKTQDNVNYRELLRQFLPSSLLGEGGDDEVEDDSEILVGAHFEGPAADHTYGQNMPSRQEEDKHNLPDEYKELTETEQEEVKNFLEGHLTSSGIITLMYRFLVQLSKRNTLLWPPGLTDIYIKIFERWRNHITQPTLFGCELDEQRTKEHGWINLIHHELKLSKWQVLRLKHSSLSSGTTQRNPGCLIAQLVPDFPGKCFYEDLDFLVHLTPLENVLKESLKEYVIRVLWFKAGFHVLECDMDLAVGCLDKMKYIISLDEDDSIFPIYLINCRGSNTITEEGVSKHLELFQRSQSLEEVHRLYEQGEYQKVVNLLKLTFTQPHTRYKEGGIPERHAQLLLLQDSLWKLKSYNECLYWGEAAFNESLQQYMVSTTTSSTQDWVDTMTQLMNGMDKCLKHEKCQLGKLEKVRLVRLSHNLIRAVCLQMDGSDLLTSLTPWILIFRVLQFEEQKILQMKESRPQAMKNAPLPPDGTVEATTGVPSSLMLLFTAHESLGRRGWCCSSEGSFLQLIVDTLMMRLSQENASASPYHEELEVGVEQCFYCMYGHPNKRTKSKHLQEHNSRQIALTWTRATQVFEYFRPKFLPEFDSYRTSTISAELENLFRRISFLVPPPEDPNHGTEPVVAYIEGGTDKYPTATKKGPISPIVQELYYLLGDYYFKNKEFGKAIKFYILDICINPERLDSWAGMALARSSQLEQKLTACDLRSDPTIYRKSSSALRCFKRALELDPSHTALWIEYGSLAYMLHAYASRQLEQQSQFNFPDDMLELLQNKRVEMLNVSAHCFLSASRCYQMGVEPVEMWLHHYMLGKISEKKRSSPLKCLRHYRIAAKYLYDEYAKFPKKIQYHNPQDFAIESLEVYYRTYACVLKYLLRLEKKEEIPNQTEVNRIGYWLKQVAKGPFANCQEKPDKDRPTLNSEAEETGSGSEVPRRTLQPKSTATTAPLDHTYFHTSQNTADSLNRPDLPSDSSSSSDDSVVVKEVMDFILASLPKQENLLSNEEDEMDTSEMDDAAVLNQDKDDIIDEDEPADLQTATVGELTDICLKAVWECHQRFSQHYKSLYRLAHFYFNSKSKQNMNKCWKFLLGGSHGLFAERKNTNFFNGIWRIPMDDIDRPGCFSSHMHRSVVLVIDLLHRQKDHAMLLQLTLQLNRTPELGKKYLRESDRLHLARSTFSLCVGMLRGNMNDLMQEEPPPEESRLILCLLDTYRAWQAFQKSSVFTDEANDMLEEAYTVYKLGEVDTSPPVIEQALAFCQAVQGKYQSGPSQESSRGNSQTSLSTPPVDSSKGVRGSDGKPIQTSKPVSPNTGGQGFQSSGLEADIAQEVVQNTRTESMPNVSIPNVHESMHFVDSYYRFLFMNCHLGNYPK